MWEHHNAGVVESIGMAWDNGAPIWPFQTLEIAVAILNDPAYFPALPICAVLRLRTTDDRNLVLLLAILLLWYWVGSRLDGYLPY